MVAVSNDSILDAAPLLEAQIIQDNTRGTLNTLVYKLKTRARSLNLRSCLAPSRLSYFSGPSDPHNVHETAWLDGVRGYASFFVFVYHFQHLFHQSYNLGYASNNGENDHWLIQLPIIRLIFMGGPMVSVFWVLSGISLSLKPIQYARAQNWERFFDTIFSSTFRRGLRLYLPVYFIQTCVLITACLGFYSHAFALSQAWPFAGTNETQFAVLDSNWAQLKDWALEMWNFTNPFRPLRPKYDVHLWTIPKEFRNSIILFATLLGFSKLRPKVRLTLTALLYTFCALVEEGDVSLFLAGMFLAEILLITRTESPPPSSSSPVLPTNPNNLEKLTPYTHQRKRAKFFWAAICLFGLHCLSIPAWNYRTTPGYQILCSLTPSFLNAEMMWQQLGAAIFLLALCCSPLLRRPFETPLALYMGRVSFPLYIVHGPITHMMGTGLVELVWGCIGREGMWRYEGGVVVGFCVTAAFVVWVADLVGVWVDVPSVRLGRRLVGWWGY